MFASRLKGKARLLTAPLLGLMTLALAAGCGGGGGSSTITPPAPATTVTGQVLTVSGSALLGRGASANTLTYGQQQAVTTGTLQLIKVNANGTADATDANFPINVALQAGGTFSVQVPEGYFGSAMIVLSHSGGLKAIVDKSNNLRVDPVSTLVFQKAAQANFSGVTFASSAELGESLRTAWAANPITAEGSTVGDLSSVLSSLSKFSVAQNISLFAPAAFCTTGTHAYFITSDYRVGALADACLNGASLTGRSNLIGTHQDAVVTYKDGVIYVLNRYQGDNLQVINAATLAVTNQVSLKATANELPNPNDIEVVSATKAFVSIYARNKLLVMDPTKSTYATANLAEINLAGYNAPSDTDGNPEAGKMIQGGGKIYLGLQRLKTADFSYDPASGSVILVIDPTGNGAITGSVELPGTNCSPEGLDIANSKLYVACNGDYFNSNFTAAPNLATDGLYAINTTTLAVTQVISNATAGNKVGGYYHVNATLGYLSLYDATTYQNTIYLFNPTTKAIGASVYSGSLADAAVDASGKLWIGNNTARTGGLTVVDTIGSKVNTTPLSLGLPPYALTFVP